MEGKKTRPRHLFARGVTTLTIALLGCAAFQCGHVEGSSQPAPVGEPKSLPSISDSRVKESSGVAPSQKDGKVFYTHNDSGDSARFFKFTLDGKVQREYRVTNATAVDWEDMSSATLDGKPYLFFGDIGDNAGRRSSIQIYRVPEPGKRRRVKADMILDLQYPDGSHNAEALLVHPSTGDITIVTKTSSYPAGVYFLPRPLQGGSYTLRKLGEVSIESTIKAGKLITGAAWSPNGRAVVLRTYLGAYLFAADDPLSWFKHAPTLVRTNFDLQGEGIAFTRDGKSLITTSEGSPCPLSQVLLP